jgi:hypothetical protein
MSATNTNVLLTPVPAQLMLKVGCASSAPALLLLLMFPDTDIDTAHRAPGIRKLLLLLLQGCPVV